MWQALLNILRIASYGSLGYFVNDLGDAGEKVFFSSNSDAIRNDKGGFKFWYIFVVLIVGAMIIGLILYFLTMLFPKPRRK